MHDVCCLLLFVTVLFSAFGPATVGEDLQGLGELRLPRGFEKPELCVIAGTPLKTIPGEREIEVDLSEGLVKIKARTRVDVVLNKDGSIRLGDGSLHGKSRDAAKNVDAIRGLLIRAVRKNYKKPNGCSVADLVIYATPKTSFVHLQKLIQVACEERIQIYRLHFAVQDGKTGKEGVLTYFLPHEFGLRSGEKPPVGRRYELFFAGDSGGNPLYRISRIGEKKEDRDFDSLSGFLAALDSLREEQEKTKFYFALGGVPYSVSAPRKAGICVEDFVRMLAALTARGVDLTASAKVYVEEYAEEYIEELEPLPDERKKSGS